MTNRMYLVSSPPPTRHEITVAGCDFAVEISRNDAGVSTAECPTLGLDAEGGSADEAYHGIIKAVTFFFEAGLELEDLQEELAELKADPEIFAKVSAYYADREFKYLESDQTDPSMPRMHKMITVAGCDFAVEIFRELCGIYVADCPSLQVATQADDAEGAYRNIIAAVTSFFEVSVRENNLQRELDMREVSGAIFDRVSGYYANRRYEVLLPEESPTIRHSIH